MCACAVACVWGWAIVGAVSPLSLCGSWGPNSRLWAWCKASLPARPSHLPDLLFKTLTVQAASAEETRGQPQDKSLSYVSIPGSWWAWERNRKWQEKEKQPFSVRRAKSEATCLRSMEAGYLHSKTQCPARRKVSFQEVRMGNWQVLQQHPSTVEPSDSFS